MKIKQYFKDSELQCPCGCGLMPDRRSILMLYAIRLIYNDPIKINSGARCKVYNQYIGGAPKSKHLDGAFDCVVPPEDEYEFIKIAQFVGFDGIGINNNKFIHIDRFHSDPTIWTY